MAQGNDDLFSAAERSSTRPWWVRGGGAAFLLVLLSGAGCLSASPVTPPPTTRDTREKPRPMPDTYTGILKSGFMGIGGEHTGWMLIRGGGESDLEVDVGKVPEKARALDGKRVKIRGWLIEKQYVERGRVPILEIASIESGGPG